MPCLQAPAISLPDLGISLPTPQFGNIELPGIKLCCQFQPPPIDMATVNAAIAAVVALIPGLGKALQPVMLVLMQYIAAINKILDKIQFSCPLN